MVVAFNLIVAVCEGMGIGKDGNLPWNLKAEMQYFTRITKRCENREKKNIVLMGRKTWSSIPEQFRPLRDRINFVLSKSGIDLQENVDVYQFKDFDSVIEKLENEKFKKVYEKVWVIGGSEVYDICMKSKYFYRLYITTVIKPFKCDTFFPKLPEYLEKVDDQDVPQGIQEENGVKYIINVYENPKYNLLSPDSSVSRI